MPTTLVGWYEPMCSRIEGTEPVQCSDQWGGNGYNHIENQGIRRRIILSKFWHDIEVV
jgi:hypothetical protein